MGADEIRQRLLGKFREITADRVERLAQSLAGWEERGGDDHRSEIARELHTLKGEARMMGFGGVASLAHAAEDLLGVLPAAHPGERAAALRQACLEIPGLLDEPPGGGPRVEEVTARIRGLMRAPRLEGAAPPVEAPRAALRGDGPAQSIRVDVDRLDEIGALSGDLLVEGVRAVERIRDLRSLLERWNRVADRLIARAERLRRLGEVREADRIEGDLHLLRVDSFRFLRRHGDAVVGVKAQMERLADRVGEARLVPLASILAGFPPAARELAREQGKEVGCEVRGADSGVDKAVLMALNDPLVHLLRNAVDHGLEDPAERERRGKPRAGRIVISARPDGDLLAVTVEDDGRGIDPERVRQGAVRRGLLSEEQAAALGAQAARELVFLPGLSTRDEAGEVSGRGIGLDVVKRKLTGLGGSVTLESEPGRFTRFTLRLPQTLSLMKVLLVRIGDDVYGLAAVDVDAVGRIGSQEVKEIGGVRSVRHRGRLLPVTPLAPLLGLGDPPRRARPLVVHVWNGSEGVALLVDGLAGEREVAVKAPGAFLRGARFVSGATLLADGRVALLLSTPELIAASYQLAGPELARVRERRRLKVLLVDDSAIAREAEAALLRSLGHEVAEAADGEAGWARLQEGDVQLLVTDVNMPVLDGIDLTRRVKASPLHAALPVVILSSLSAAEERRRGADAGADAYLVKGELDPEVLAATLERLCGVAP
jgi:two-component system chemotaxis sensor kinase CheA/two-component system sensor histidine kinase and response regulator WspE